MKKIYPSSSGFAWGNLVFSEYKTACLRNILLAAHGIREPDIEEKYKVIGALNEDLHEELLKSRNIKYDREFVVKHPIDGFDDMQFSGRVDFLVHGEHGDSIDELKGTDSKNTKRNIMENGAVRVEHLAQITAYMISLKLTKGRLVYGYYELDKVTKKYEQRKSRAFEILIDDFGRICVDAAPTQFTVGDQLRHRMLTAKILSENIVWDRPNNHNVPFKSPCTYCPWNSTCKKYDENLIERTTEAFVKDGHSALETLILEKKNE